MRSSNGGSRNSRATTPLSTVQCPLRIPQPDRDDFAFRIPHCFALGYPLGVPHCMRPFVLSYLRTLVALLRASDGPSASPNRSKGPPDPPCCRRASGGGAGLDRGPPGEDRSRALTLSGGGIAERRTCQRIVGPGAAARRVERAPSPSRPAAPPPSGLRPKAT